MSMLILVLSLFFFFNDTATTEIYTLSLHDALPISYNITTGFDNNGDTVPNDRPPGLWRNAARGPGTTNVDARLSKRWGDRKSTRLNSSHLVISYAVFCLKKKKKKEHTNNHRKEV